MGQNLEAFDIVGPFDNFQSQFSYNTKVPNPLKQLTCVSAVRPDEAKARKATLDFVQHKHSTIAVLNVRRMYYRYQHKAKYVDQ